MNKRTLDSFIELKVIDVEWDGMGDTRVEM